MCMISVILVVLYDLNVCFLFDGFLFVRSSITLINVMIIRSRKIV